MRSLDFRSSFARIGLSSSVCFPICLDLGSFKVRRVDDDAKEGVLSADMDDDDAVRLNDGIVGDEKPDESGESSSSSHG